MEHPSYQIPATLLLAALPGLMSAQSTLVDWNQSWNYFHPTNGVLPDESGLTTPHPDDSTPWFATETEFINSYTGPSFTTGGLGFESGSGQGPIGYGAISYTVDAATPEFTSFGTNLRTPISGDRFTAYFRTTFVVPNDGNFYINPSIRYLLDDGGFIYLDGQPLLEVNVAANALDAYTTRAAGTTNTESVIRTADLSLAPGTRTGGSDEVDPAAGANATLVQSITRLTPGIHTLAVAVHNTSPTSSDLALAVQLVSETTDCLISGSASSSIRDLAGTPADLSDDTISADVTIVPEGNVAATWEVTGPAGSALIGTTGAYNTPLTLGGIPISEFATGNLVLEIADSTNATCTTTVSILPQRIIGQDSLSGNSIVTVGDLQVSGWAFDESLPTLTLNNPAGGELLYTITSNEVSLSGAAQDVQFTGTLTITDGSTGNEIEDSCNAYLILDGDTNNPVSLIDEHDNLIVDGLLTAGELAPNAGTFVRSLDAIIPASVNSAQLVIEAINNSGNETFTVSNLGFAIADPALTAYARPVVYDNQGTDDPGDDVFTADFVITPANLGASTGWNSNETPAAGLYEDGNPVTFGPFRPFRTPLTVTLTDDLDPTKSVTVPLTLDDPALTVSAPLNITRVENGPGFDDDTLTFDLEILGNNGGPGWKINTAGISPNSGDFGPATFTISAPLIQGPFTFEIVDRSYRNVAQNVTINVPGRVLIGQSDLSGTLEDVNSRPGISPSAFWVNDLANRTLTYNQNSTALQNVFSETLDLSAQGTVYFSALMTAAESSTTSNFETNDRFGADLFYRIDDQIFTVYLAAPYDTGNGSSAIVDVIDPSDPTTTLMGQNGPPNNFINGYSGAPGTDLVTDAEYTTNAENYDANRDRDEFNRSATNAADSMSAIFPLAAEIPAAAQDAYLVIRGQGSGGNESFVVSNVLFSTEPPVSGGDSDSDDIPDDYEIANGLNPNDAGDRDLDFDGDGSSNYAEFLAGTAANDPTSNLRITGYSINGTIVSTAWSSVPGKSYRVEFSTDLESWTDLGFTFPAAEAPAVETSSGDFDLTGIGAPPAAYFRVSVVTE